MPHTGRLLAWAGAVVGLVILIVPTLIVIPISFGGHASFHFPPEQWSTRWYERLVEEPRWRVAMLTSLAVALLSALVAAVVGTAAALGLRRIRRLAVGGLVRGTLLVPLIVPEIVVAVGLYSVFLDLGLVGTWPGFVLAHCCLGVPLVVTTVSASLTSFDSNLERAAASLGAGPWSTVRKVTLPVVMPGLMSGALFAFILSLDNLVLSLFLQTPDLSTLPVLMWSSMTRDTDPTIAAAATVILLVTTVVLVLAVVTVGRRTALMEKERGLL
ncbi:ABC transporter permease [Streptomyces sp. NPDC050625]|uniref:ABC transporter permease n=1 Tax=Streptomyces sp. NPDC050625 TaxID=3154629 RepID=UPI00343D930D